MHLHASVKSHTPHSSQMLFEISTLEMWPDALHLVMDTVGTDVAPQRDANIPMSLYVILWILISNFFLLQA